MGAMMVVSSVSGAILVERQAGTPYCTPNNAWYLTVSNNFARRVLFSLLTRAVR